MKPFFSLLLVFSCISLSAQVNETQLRGPLEDAARKHGLSPADVDGYFVTTDYTRSGNTHVYLTQTVHGHEIFNAILQLHFSADGSVYSNSRFVADKTAKTNASVPSLDARTALGKAAEAVHISLKDQPLKTVPQAHPDRVWLLNETLFRAPVRSTLGYEHTDGRLLLAYKLIVEPRGTSDMYNIRVDALTGEIIRIDNRTRHCEDSRVHNTLTHAGTSALETAACQAPEKVGAVASYRAYPLGIESPLYGARTLFSGAENPAASPFGWHDDNGVTGEEYSITRGNNVYAYEDQQDNNFPGYSPDAGASMAFDYPLNFNLAPEQNMDAALTNLFVWNNFMHDVTYHYGFDEVSGNFQANNYGNGGAGDDYVHAQGFDGSGTNNANFGTPEDGMNPTMQMYLWYHTIGELLTVNSPAVIAGDYQTGGATFGPPPPATPITANLVLMNGTPPNTTQGCGAISNAAALNGKIAVADRGSCTFVEKAQNAQDAGAIALIVINNQGGGAMSMGGDDFGSVTIPCISVSQADGALIKAQLQSNVTVNGSVGGTAQDFVFDCNFDNGVICHEYGHGVSNRLTGGPQNVDCLFNDEQAGEGWSDFFAMVMTDVPGSSANQVRGMGNYASGDPANGLGIRPYPYTHNMAVNPLTYEDIDGLSIPHGVGTVWCSMLWDLYWDMVAVYGHSYDLYGQTGGNNKTIRLVVEGMRLQACEPGFVDARDAILQADQMLYAGANQCIIWKAFARRGLGFSADQGSSQTVGDETEAFDLPPGCSQNDVSFTASTTAICEGQTVSFQSQVIPSATSYEWSFPGGSPGNSTDPVATVTYATPGTYAVTLTATNANGTQSHTVPAYIQVSPDITFTVNTTPSGNGNNGSATVSVTAGTAPYHYSWSATPNIDANTYTGLAPGQYTVTVSNESGCSASQNFTIADVSGTEEYGTASLSVFPNPAENLLTVSADEPVLQLRITDLSGKTIRNATVNASQTSVDVSDLAAGTYLLHVQTASYTWVRKIVKK